MSRNPVDEHTSSRWAQITIVLNLISKYEWLLLDSPLWNWKPRHCSPPLPSPPVPPTSFWKFLSAPVSSGTSLSTARQPTAYLALRPLGGDCFPKTKGLLPEGCSATWRFQNALRSMTEWKSGWGRAPPDLCCTLSAVLSTSLVCVWDVTYLTRKFKSKPSMVQMPHAYILLCHMSSSL